MAVFLEEHGEDVEADLLRFFNIDLPEDIGTERLTWRRLAVLLKRMPKESCIAATFTPKEEKGWDMDTMLLAEAVDRLGMSIYMLGHLSLAHSKKGTKNPVEMPKPVPRPGVVSEVKKKNKGMKALMRALGAPI